MKKKKKSNDTLYVNLQQSFIKLRALFSAEIINPNKLDAVLGDLRFVRKQLQKHTKRRPRKILTYCIDTLFEIIEEGNREKIYDFADLIHNMPEIALKKRTFRSFSKEIEAFNHKYEEFCFSDINTIHINISKETFEDLRKSAKTRSPLIFTVAIALFLLPLICSIFYVSGLKNVSAFPVLTVLGALLIGVGLANIPIAFSFQYRARKVTAPCLLIGGTMIAIAVFMINNPRLYDPDVSTLYFVSLLSMLWVPPIFYFLFRSGVEDWVMRTKHISKSRIRELKTGKKNYWWFEALHKEENLGGIYLLNKFYTLLYTSLFALTLLTGLVKEMYMILCPMHAVLYALTAYMNEFSQVQHNIEHYGKPFVLLARTTNKHLDSSLLDLIGTAVILSPAYIIIQMTAMIW